VPAELCSALARLDALLRAMAEGAPGERPLVVRAGEPASRLAGLGPALGLDDFELDVLLVALCPEIDLAYAVYFASLQGDPAAVRPTVDTILGILSASPGERLERRRQLAADAPLLRGEVIRLLPSATGTWSSALVEVDPHVTAFLLGGEDLDPRLGQVARLVTPRAGLEVDESHFELLGEAGDRSILFLEGVGDAGTLEAAEALAGRSGRRLLALDIRDALDYGLDVQRTVSIAARDAAMLGALLCLTDIDDVEPRRLRALTPPYPTPTLAVGASARSLDEAGDVHVVVVPVAPPRTAERRRAWERALVHVPAGADIDALASRFRLGPTQIERAVSDARDRARLRAAVGGDGRLSSDDLFAGARSRSGHRLAALTRKLEPVFVWDDIVLPDDSLAQLREICARVTHRDLVIETWGFRRTLGVGLGVSALFAGSSGTGKTMAAGILANGLGVDLYAIDLASIVSKYIGETSKNLDRIFQAAEDANAILFFDEADALFGKRSEVRDSHDRYANVEIAYLLQKMEAYDGVAILATNLRQNLDEAFARRFSFTVHFPFPGAEERLEIWRRVWPDEVTLDDDVDLDDLAERFRLSGGNIRNAAIAATFLAAEDGGTVARSHLLRAVRREYQKLGRGLADEDLEGIPAEALA
jgi:hypothetical protein